jgi:hypothetical protein
MKVIFLDFDGPLISHRSRLLPGHELATWRETLADLPESIDSDQLGAASLQTPIPKFDPVAVSIIQKLLFGHLAMVVITSSWKKLGLKNIQFILDLNGLPSRWLHLKWCTESDSGTMRRSDEIAQWLKQASHAGEEILSYAAIDDDPSILNLAGGVLVPYSDGIRWADFCSASAALGHGIVITNHTMRDGHLIADVSPGVLGEIPVGRFGNTLRSFNFGPVEMSKGAAPRGCVRCSDSPYQIVRIVSAEGAGRGAPRWSH